MKKRTLIFGLLIWTITICLIPALLWSKEFKFPLRKEFTLEKPLDLELDDPRGEIILESHNQNKIVIQANKIVEALSSKEADDLARRIRVDIEKSGALVRVKTKYQKAEEGSFLEKLFSVKKSVGGYVSYHILVPKKIHEAEISVTSGEIKVFYLNGHMNLLSTSGDIELIGIDGDIYCSVTSGSIRAKEIKGELSLQGTSSDMKLKKVEGELKIDCTSGSVFIQDLYGSLKSTQTSGDLEVKGLTGNLSASNTSGDIWLEQSQGSVDLNTTSGDIEARIQILPSKYYYIETISGDIYLYVPKDTQADLEVETTSGEINLNIPMTLQSVSRQSISGTLGSGGGRVEISTISGDINLEEY